MDTILCPSCSAENSAANTSCSECSSELLLNGRYYLIRKLGGKDRVTYLGFDSVDKKKVIIKEQSLKQIENWGNRDAFMQESAVLSQIHHKAIPRLIDTFVVSPDASAPGPAINARSYIVTGFIDGIPLTEEIRHKRYTESEVIDIIKELAGVIEYLQSLRPPVIHGNLNLSNIIRRPDGSLAVIGFGKVTDMNTVNETREPSDFMAPEQLEGRPGLGTDFYALGVIAAVLLTRKMPAGIMENGLLRRDIFYGGPEIVGLLEKLLSKDADVRVRSLEDIKNILRQAPLAVLDLKVKREFNRINDIFEKIPTKKNCKTMSERLARWLFGTTIGVFAVTWYFQTWYWGLLLGALVFFAGGLRLEARIKKLASPLLDLMMESSDPSVEKELTLVVVRLWSSLHGMDLFFKDILKEYQDTETMAGRIDPQKIDWYEKKVKGLSLSLLHQEQEENTRKKNSNPRR